jgi:hypothetical protein
MNDERNTTLSFIVPTSSFGSFPLQLVLRVLAFAHAIFFEFDFGGSAGDLDFGSVIQVIALGALEPGHFAVFFCHDNTSE